MYFSIARMNSHTSKQHSLEASFNTKLIKFGPIDRHDLISLGRHYYTQELMYNNDELIFTTDWFKSEGIHYGLDKKPEMLVPTSPYCFRVFKAVEDEAIRVLKFPSGYQMKQTNEEVLKHLVPMNKVYAKLNRDAAFF